MSIDLPVLRSVMKGRNSDYCVWEPFRPIIIVGRGGVIEREVFTENCLIDNVPIYKRRTGGGAVVLAPGTLVFSLARITGMELHIKEYARQVNDLVIRFLEDLGVKNLSVRGISDICIGHRKIMGSGMYRRKKTLFFQGSILVNPDLSLMDRYLKPPPRTPDYRMDRPHGEFVTTLAQNGLDKTTGELVVLMDEFWKNNIEMIF